MGRVEGGNTGVRTEGGGWNRTIPKPKERVSSGSSGSDSHSEVNKKLKGKQQVAAEKSVKKQKTGETSPALSSHQRNKSRDGNTFPIGERTYVSVRPFKGKVLTEIREYWMHQEGEMTRGRKNSSLNPKQWSLLKEQISDLYDSIRKL
ncbi:PREDICTED: activated RNA polymerase II transcriptional coactivator p15-like [Elephantulus edwardii]|uniref:activated RNA polymerase II transcriptional coactivator p15-like n=1 Tax=Elephantulus edwardii TaxID=28737 RepID=UPI0003F0DCEE|nr:PREDICTED: activated RNA polymerase II transcriptional coactivator p15-like [Elephantulus edwardii]